MRKFLMVVAVGALTLLMAAPVMAVDFKFGAEYRVRMYDAVNWMFTNVTGSNPRGVQIRIRPIFDVSDDNGNIQARLRFEIGDVEFGNGGGANGPYNGVSVTPGSARVGNGAGGSIGNDGVNVETKSAYIDFALPFGVPGRMRTGMQAIYFPKGLIFDDDAAGIKAYGTVKPISYELFWYRVNGGQDTSKPTNHCVAAVGGAVYVKPAAGCLAGDTAVNLAPGTMATTVNTLDNNYDFFGFKLDAALAPFFNPGVYYIYGANKAGNPAAVVPQDTLSESHYFGLTATGKLGIASYDVDWIYGSAEGGVAGTFVNAAGVRVKTKGWALDGHVAFPVGPVTINLAGAYITGDKRDGGDSEAFPSPAGSWNGAGGGFEMIGSGGPFDAVEFTQEPPTNIWMLGGWIEYVPVKQLWLKAAYGYAGFVDKLGNCAGAPANTCYGPAYAGKGNKMIGSGGIGHEFSLRADYTLWTNFKIQGQLGWLFPKAGASTAAEYVLQFLYSF
jgi:hypothetical protein